MAKKLKDWPEKKRSPARFRRLRQVVNIVLILVLAFSISSLMTLYIDDLPQSLEVGAVATKDFKAHQNYEIVDERSTAKLSEEALQNILPVYDFNITLEQDVATKIHESFEGARLFVVENSSPDVIKMELSPELEGQLKREFQDKLGLSLTPEQYTASRKSHFSSPMEKVIILMTHEKMRFPIIHNKDELEPLLEKGVVLRRLSQEGPFPEETIHDLENIFDLKEAKKQVAELSYQKIKDQFEVESLDRDNFRTTKKMAADLVKANVNYNGIETDARKQKAVGNIKNIIIKIKRGESIIRSGDRFEPWHLTVIEGIRKTRLKTNRFLKFIGVFLFVNLVLLIVYYYASKYIRKFRPNRRDLVFLGLSLPFFLLVLRVGVFLASSIRDALPFEVGVSTLYYAIPVAAGAMLVRFILNSETALVFAVIVSLFSGIFLENNLEMTVYFLISGVFAAHAIAYVDKRSTVLLCGAVTGLVNALTVFSLNLISHLVITGSVDSYQVFLNCVSGFLGGLFTAMAVLILTPVCEVIFNYTTDIKLLELATLSHPLLKQMIVRSPGTYHHSQLVGILAEAGAQAISANPLLARVASYYHDIGKMKKPQYFIENQRGHNPHNKLSPSMSALIVGSHVKDGMEMAREYKLPQKIADMIPQHQGTKLISYFYTKAKESENASMGRINERDYRYSGPRPQTREAGVIMLADAIEAAVRSLPERTPPKIKTTVEKLINHHFIDEQLDECDLTLRDLHLIAQAFIKILNGIYHQRVEYPEGTLAKAAEVHSLYEKSKSKNESVSQQRTSSESNIAPLFRKKD